jgi:uncharacterized protein YebE (UPF0316 family)
MELTQNDLIEWVAIPLFIFFARICDVSLDTMRIINVNGNNKWSATILGFFQVLIWLFAVQQIMENLDNFFYYIIYAGGFAAGNYAGLIIQDKLVKGIVLVRVIADQSVQTLGEKLYLQNIKSTQMEGTAHDVDKKTFVMLIIASRKKTDMVIESIESTCPGAFYSVQDIRHASEDSLNKLHIIDSKKEFNFPTINKSVKKV